MPKGNHIKQGARPTKSTQKLNLVVGNGFVVMLAGLPLVSFFFKPTFLCSTSSRMKLYLYQCVWTFYEMYFES